MMDLDELQSVRDRERQTDKLQQLRESFYADAGEFIQQLRDQRERAADRADDPFDAPEVNRLSDEIDTAEQTVEAIYEKRVGKIVKAASFAAADLPAESDGMTAEEQDLFETLVDDIKSNRQHVLAVLAGEAPPDDDARDVDGAGDDTGPIPDGVIGVDSTEPDARPDPTPPADGDEPTPPEPSEESDVTAADVMGGSPDPSGADSTEPAEPPADNEGTEPTGPPDTSPPPQVTAGSDSADPEVREDGGTTTSLDAQSDSGATEGATGAGVDRETVRITADVGDIFGVDEREYDLAENDVVTLPSANAAPLVDRDAAERLD